MSTNVGQANITIKADASSARATIQQAAQQMRRDLAGLTGLKVGATVALKAPTKAEVAAALSGIKGEKTIKVKVDSADAAATIGRIKTLLSNLSSSVSGLFSVNTTGLGTILSATTSMNTQFRETVNELRRVLEEIRRTRPPTGPPATSTGTGSNPFGGQLRALQGDLRAGVVSTEQYEQATRALKTAIDAEITSLRALGVLTTQQQAKLDGLRASSGQAATALATLADRQARAGRTAEIDRVRLSMARLRAEFDDGLRDEAAYHAENLKLIASLKDLGTRADFTTKELKQLADLQGRLAREANTVAGVANPTGLSGNAVTAMRSAIPELLQGLRGVASLSPSLGAASSTLASMVDTLVGTTAPLRGMTGNLGGVTSALGDVGGASGAARGGVALLGGAAAALVATIATLAVGLGVLAAALNTATVEYSKFERGLAQVATLTNFSTAQLENTGRRVLQLSMETGATFQDLNAGLYDVMGAGVKGTESMAASLELLRQATILAKAGATDTATATDVLTSVLNAYKMEAGDAGRVSDMLFQAVKDGKVSFDQLAQSLGMVLPIAAQAGVRLDEVLAAVAAMTAQGIKPSSAVEYLRSALTNVIKPSEQAAATAKDLGLQFDAQALKAKGLVGFLRDVQTKTKGNSEAMSRLFGDVGGVTSVLAIASGNFERMTQALNGQQRSAGATADAYGKMAATIDEKTSQVTAKWKALWVGVGELFAPTKMAVLEGIDDILTKLNEALGKFIDLKRLNGAGDNLMQLQRDRGGLVDQLRIGEAQLKGTTDPEQRRRLAQALEGVKGQIAALDAKIAEARAYQTQVRAEQFGPTLGPSLADRNAPPPPATNDTNSSVYQSTVAMQAAIRRTGVKTADAVVDYCAQWVRLTLGNADKKIAPIINQLFQADANKDGRVTANDAAQNVRNAGLMRSFTGLKDLMPGDTVFYEDGGAGHVGIYIGGGMVRGNNRVTYAQNGGKFDAAGNPISKGVNPVGSVGINQLGTVTGFARSSELAGYKGAPAASGGTGTGAPAQVTAALIAKAQGLLDRVTAAQKAAQASPGNAALKVAYSKATEDLEKWTRANEANASALKAVQDTQEKGARSTGDYIASQANLNQYGAEALKRYKALKVAEESGVAARVTAAQQSIKAWIGEDKVRKAVFDAESAAYQTRLQNAERDKSDRERREKEAQAKAQQATQQGIELGRLLREGRVQQAEGALAELKATQQEELRLAGDNVAKRLEILKRSGPVIINAETQIAQGKRDVAVKDAQIWADAELEKAKATLSGQALRARQQQIEEARVGKVNAAYAEAARVIRASERASQEAVTTASNTRTAALAGLEKQYQSAMDTFSKKLVSGTVTDDDLIEYWRSLNANLTAAKQAGLEMAPTIAALRNQSRALAQEGPGVQAWAAAFGQAKEVSQARYGNADAVMDYSLRGSFGAGEAGYQAALKSYGVRSIDELQQYNEVAANAMRRVYADVLAKMEQDMADAVERAQAILDYYKGEADRIADNTATQADLAVGRKNQEDGARVAGLSKAGPFGMLNFLGGASNSFFGEKYWTELGEQGRADFTDALNRFEPEDFSRLGVTFLRGIRDKIGNSPEWADLTAKLNSGIELAQAQGSSKAGFAGIGQVIAQYNQLDTRSAAYADTIRTKLIPELVRIRDASSDQSVKDMAAGAIEALTGEVDAARQLADLAVEGKLQALDTQRALGAIGERAYQAQRQQLLIEQETARYRLDIQDKTGAALELAEAQHQLRLGKIIGDGLVQSADLTKSAQDKLKRAQEELNQVLGIAPQVYQGQIDALELLKKELPEHAAEIERLIAKYRELQQLDPLVQAFKGASQILGKNSPLQAGLSSVTDGLSAFFGAGGAKGGKEAILKGAASLVGGLVDVFKTGDEDVDRVTNTFVSGLQGTLMQLAQGNWVGALIAGVATVVSTIVDIFVGGANSAKKARDQIKQATDGIKFFDLSKYAKVESRGGFLGFLGFKKSSIDQEALDIARTLGDAIYTAISGGMLDGIKAGKTNFADLGIDLKKTLAENILQGLIDGFIQGEVMKNLIQPFLDKFIAARKTADPADDVQAAADLQQAIITGNSELANFYQTVLVPTSQQLGVFGQDAAATAPVGGNAAADLGLPSSVQLRLDSQQAAQQQAAQQNVQAAQQMHESVRLFDQVIRTLQNGGISADLRILQPTPEIRTRVRSGALLNG